MLERRLGRVFYREDGKLVVDLQLWNASKDIFLSRGSDTVCTSGEGRGTVREEGHGSEPVEDCLFKSLISETGIKAMIKSLLTLTLKARETGPK